MNNKAIAIVGTTASGKTGLAVKLAKNFNGEIISADSRQVYKGLDIGSGKDLPEYTLEENGVTYNIQYHLIDVADPKNFFNLADFKEMATVSLKDILKREKLPIVAGGTGLYVQSLIDNYELSNTKPNEALRTELEKLNTNELYDLLEKKDKSFAKTLNNSDKNNRRRLIRYLEIKSNDLNFQSKKKPNKICDFLILGITHPRPLLKERIEARLKQRLDNEGLIDEVKKLHQDGLSWERLYQFGLEYRYISQYLKGEINIDDMFGQLNNAIGQFAKRQMTWLRRWERQGAKINWVDNYTEAKKLVEDFIKK